jgi:hypothetical protein
MNLAYKETNVEFRPARIPSLKVTQLISDILYIQADIPRSKMDTRLHGDKQETLHDRQPVFAVN